MELKFLSVSGPALYQDSCFAGAVRTRDDQVGVRDGEQASLRR